MESFYFPVDINKRLVSHGFEAVQEFRPSTLWLIDNPILAGTLRSTPQSIDAMLRGLSHLAHTYFKKGYSKMQVFYLFSFFSFGEDSCGSEAELSPGRNGSSGCLGCRQLLDPLDLIVPWRSLGKRRFRQHPEPRSQGAARATARACAASVGKPARRIWFGMGRQFLRLAKTFCCLKGKRSLGLPTSRHWF